MSVLFNSISRHNLSDKENPKMWYANINRFTEREPALQATEEVTLSPMELEMAFYQFRKQLIYALLNGKTVQLRDPGTFCLTCNSNATGTQEEVIGSLIKKLNIRFRPTAEFREKMKKATFKRIEKLLNNSAVS